MPLQRDDRILPATRAVAWLVFPILILAFIILFLTPEQTGQRFAWEIRPNLMAAYMGAGYLGGAWLFIRTALGRRWHQVAAGFLPVTTFTSAMLLATILHWGRFDPRHFPFLLWLALYVVTPFLVPWLWLRNRQTDPGAPEPGDQTTPSAARYALIFLGGLLLLFAVAGFLAPNWLINLWVWNLTPLTARILSGWFGLLGVGGVVIGRERRWSAWRVGLESIGLWHILVLAGAVMYAGDFKAGLVNWYVISVALVVVGIAGLYGWMWRGAGRSGQAG